MQNFCSLSSGQVSSRVRLWLPYGIPRIRADSTVQVCGGCFVSVLRANGEWRESRNGQNEGWKEEGRSSSWIIFRMDLRSLLVNLMVSPSRSQGQD